MQELKFKDFCANCRSSLNGVEKFYFVEQEVGRCFCTEHCIQDYFQPIVDSMKEEWRRNRQAFDIHESMHPKFYQHQHLTLGDPDEVWVDTAKDTGEKVYTFISHFHDATKDFSYVVVCLTLNENPSFVFLSFPTKDEALVDLYRKGTDLRVQDEASEHAISKISNSTDLENLAEVIPINRDASAQSPAQSNEQTIENVAPHDFDTLHKMLRQPNDIPLEEMDAFLDFVEPSIEDPDEIWRYIDDEGNEWYTFISKHVLGPDQEHSSGVDEFYVVAICESVWDEDTRQPGFEVLYAFATIDQALLQYFRKGISSLNKSFGMSGTRSRAA